MKMKALRWATLVPLFLALISWTQPLFPKHSFLSEQLMTASTAFGVTMLAVVWFLYFSGYRFGRKLLLYQGITSALMTATFIAGYFFNFTVPLERYLLPSDIPFMLNLAYMFMAIYLIQILTYWLPRTKALVNASLAIILFMSLLSVFGQLYSQAGIKQVSLLLPMPFAAIVAFLILSLIIFAYANRMERLYLNSRIVISFALMFVAIIGANVVVYKNISRTISLSTQIDDTRHVLLESYNIDFYLDSAQTEVRAYTSSGDPKYIASYQNSKHSYTDAITKLKKELSEASNTSHIYQSILTVDKLGNHILALGDNAIAQKRSEPATLTARTALDKEMDIYMDQVLEEVKGISLDYTRQLDNLTEQEAFGGRGIVLGVSITSALSMLLIIFTPLFIRQMIQKIFVAEQLLKNSNKLLSEEKSRAEAILTSIGDGLFAVDTEHTITLFNQAAEEITGLKKEEALGRRYDEIMHFALADNPDAKLDFTAKALRGEDSHLSHNITLRRSDKKLDVQVSASPVQGKTGEVVGAIIVFRDRSNEQALDNAKDEFVSLASHQLRTPATATKQFLAMFLQGYAGHIDDKQRIFLQEAYDNNELGINIIEELLNITRLESNKFKVTEEKIELGEFLRNSVKQHEAFANRGKQKIQLIAPSKHVIITADISLLGMAVDNLVTNALKYSGESTTVTVRLTDGQHPTIAVSDSGIGIKKEDVPRIFERFTRLEDPNKQHVSGTGIGLYLVQKIAQQLHAKIRVDSTYGKGSTFTLEFK